jgi:hypothetical protein
VFSSWRGVYSATPLESYLQEVFGETIMDDVGMKTETSPDKFVTITSVKVNQKPPVLHLFRNYDGPNRYQVLRPMTVIPDGWYSNPIVTVDRENNEAEKKKPIISIDKQCHHIMVDRDEKAFVTIHVENSPDFTITCRKKDGTKSPQVYLKMKDDGHGTLIILDVKGSDSGLYTVEAKNTYGSSSAEFTLDVHELLAWEVARATSAAPMYFAKYQKYVDGGVIANNPTVDTLTEIQRMINVKQAKSTSSNGHAVDRSTSWSHGITARHFRITPLLNENFTELYRRHETCRHVV